MTLHRRFRRVSLVVAALLIAVAAPSIARTWSESFKPGALRLDPNTTRSATTLKIDAEFEQQTGEQLQAYNVDIARGFRFDPHAVKGRCTVAQARSSSCPASSRIGGGDSDVTISGPGVAPQRSNFDVDFFLMRAQKRGDIAAVVLSVHQAGSSGAFSLIGRVVRLKHGKYGLELRFDDAAKQLPQNVTVQLNHVHAHVGAQRGGHSLLTTPRKCTKKGWPFRLVVAYATETRTYSGPVDCAKRR